MAPTAITSDYSNHDRTRLRRYRWLTGTIAVLIHCLICGSALAAELLMFEEQDCPYCEKWKAEVGIIYNKTPQGLKIPLTPLYLYAERPARLKAIADLRYTPTFVVWHQQKEIGRIVGYPGEDFFWGLLEQIIAKLPDSAETCTSSC